jgi:hypothetical protein
VRTGRRTVKTPPLQRNYVYKRSWEGILVTDWEKTAEMEKKKALQKAAGITTIEGLQQIVGDLVETTLPDVSM